MVDNREATEELAGPGEYALSRPLAQKPGYQSTDSQPEGPQSLYSHLPFPLPTLSLQEGVSGLLHHMRVLQGKGPSCVGEAAARGEQSTAVIVPPLFRASFGHLCVYVLCIALQSNPVLFCHLIHWLNLLTYHWVTYFYPTLCSLIFVF